MANSHTTDSTMESDKQISSRRDFTEVISELRRKHELILSTWNALDAKLGILLGVVAIVLLEIVSNYGAIRAVDISTGNIYLNIILFIIFWAAIILFICATYTGLRAISVKRFKDINAIEEVDNFITHKEITNELFLERLSSLLYDYIEINEKHRDKKAHAVSCMIVEIGAAIGLIVIRFFALCCLFK